MNNFAKYAELLDIWVFILSKERENKIKIIITHPDKTN